MKSTLGQRIAQRRKELELTQADLAEKMGVTDKAVSKWERDLSCPDVSSLPQLAQVLGLSVEELIQCKSPKISSENTPFDETADIALNGVGLAMGISVAVLSILDRLYLRNGMMMLGIGLACLAISSLNHKEKN